MFEEENPPCVCGHKVNRSHKFDFNKMMKTGKVHGKCNFCDCKEVILA